MVNEAAEARLKGLDAQSRSLDASLKSATARLEESKSSLAAARNGLEEMYQKEIRAKQELGALYEAMLRAKQEERAQAQRAAPPADGCDELRGAGSHADDCGQLDEKEERSEEVDTSAPASAVVTDPPLSTMLSGSIVPAADADAIANFIVVQSLQQASLGENPPQDAASPYSNNPDVRNNFLN